MTRRLVHVFPAFAGGGPEVRTSLLINAMPDFAHTVVSLNGDSSGCARLAARDTIAFRPLPGHGGLRRLGALGRALQAEHPDLVVTYGWGGTDAILALRRVGMRRPVHVEDGFLPDEAQRQRRMRLHIRRLAFRLTAELVVPSQTLQRIATNSWWLPATRVQYIPNGVDTARFHPASKAERATARRAIGAHADEVIIGTVAALRPDKNHRRLVRAFAAVSATRATRLVIVGDGPAREAIEAEARALGVADRVELPGLLIDPAPCYHAFDVFALTSDTEQMPLSVLEAMASALPIVSTDVGDIHAMVPGEGRLLATLGDDRALQDSMQRAYNDRDWRARAGQVNRAHAEAEFSLHRMIAGYRDTFERHLRARSREA